MNPPPPPSPTHVVYIDDSGTKEYASTSDQYGTGVSRYFVFGSVLLTTAESGSLVKRIRAAKVESFGTNDVEIKSNWLRMPKERKARYLDAHGISEKGLTEFVEKLYSIIGESDLCVIAAVIDKVHMQAKYPRPWYPPAAAYEVLMQRVVQEVTEPRSISVVIDDMSGATPNRNQYKDNLRAHHRRLRASGSSLLKGVSFAPLAGDIRFVDSRVADQVQVADVVSYNVYRQFVEYGDDWERISQQLPTYPWFARIGEKFRQGPGGRIQGYGVIKFPMLARVPWRVKADINDKAAP